MISEVDIRDMLEIVERVEEDAALNFQASPFTMSEYDKLKSGLETLLRERQSKIARLFLPLVNWV